MSGKLVLVPTPIGNLEDITLRAIKTLKTVDAILAEDTRQTIKLLKHYEIEKPLMAYHMHNEHKELNKFIELLKSGKNLALVSDAGTPAISDPGFLLVRECTRNEIEVSPATQFVFEGFLPEKKGRQTAIKKLAEEERTIILYEAPHRLVKCLTQLKEFFGPERQAAVCRELSKMFEETKRGSIQELIDWYEKHPPKGEIVIVIHGKLN